MKFLSLHVDYINFKPLKKALRKIADLTGKDKEGGSEKEALTIMTAVEKGDSDIKGVVEKFVEEVKNIAEQVKVKTVVLYPYAHLSSDLASPDLATNVLDAAEKELKKIFKVVRAPFGYYKEFEMKVKGHPLSELSREIRLDTLNNLKGVKGTSSSEESYDYKQLLREVSKSKLDSSKLKDNDHRILGQQMDLFSFSEVAPGMVFWHNNGLIIYNELIKYWREMHRKTGYQEVRTPQILDKKLWQISGHWEKYRDNIFLTDYDKRTFAVKPMNCPGGLLIYKNKPKSYKELPLRAGELGIVHRQELSGTLGGLFRVVQITQDDAHIFCTEKQVEQEIEKIIDLVEAFYAKFNLTFRVEISTRPEKRIGSDKIWDKTENILKKVVKKRKLKSRINESDGAFYGPKIDFHVTDSLGREWQTATIQLDMSMPERFDLEYTDKDNKKKRPLVLHRTIYGSLERFIGILIEHTKGRLPTWLAPIQCRVISFTDRNEKYSKEVIKKIGEAIPEIRMDADFTQTTVQSKVKEAEIMKVPHIIVVGDNEEKEGVLAIRVKGNKKIQKVGVDEFISKIKSEIQGRQ
jgi:threonyl-tRNA synthetase